MQARRLKAGVIALALVFATGCTSTQAPAPQTPQATPAPAAQGAAPAVPDASKLQLPKEMTKVKVALGALTATVTPIWVAMDEGIFKKNNLDVETVLVTSGSTVAQVIESGDIQIGTGNQSAVVDARLAGADSIIIAGIMNTYFFQIYGKPKYSKVEDLKGKIIAASTAGSASDHAVKEMMAMAGYKQGDYEVAFVGGTSARLAALQKGVVDAAVISPPEGLKAKEAGLVEIANLIEMGVPFGYSGLQTSRKWLAANRPVALAFVKAYAEARALIEKEPALAHKALAKYTETNDKQIIAESYRNIVPGIPRIPLVEEKIIAKALAESENPKAKTAKPSDFYDNSLIKELEDAGLFKELYQ